jgi:hypothetical protein
MVQVAFADAGHVHQLRTVIRDIRLDAEARWTEILDRPTQ